MRTTNRCILAAAVVLIGVCIQIAPGRQATTQPAKPAPRTPPDDNEFVVSPMRVQDMRAVTYMYGSMETTYAEMGEPIRVMMEALTEGITNGQVPVRGPALFIYHGATQDPNKKFTLEVGFPVDESAREFGDFKVKQLDPFHCATVLYSGPIQSVVNAYQQVFTDLMGANLQPTGETREYYLMWEGLDSVNNITLIQIGVK